SPPPNSDSDRDHAPRPKKRRVAAPLFLPPTGSDDDDDDTTMPDVPPRRTRQEPEAPPKPAFDVDALFDMPQEQYERPGEPAAEDASVDVPAFTPHQITSSSPAHHLGGDDEQASGEKDKGETKPKKKVMRLDEGRLVGESGFPQLIRDTKNLKIKGKGHEASDLNRLLQVYQFWTHRLYPKTPFKDTVERVEKLCHSKRMHNMLSVWRDEAHGISGKAPGENDEHEHDAMIDLTEPSVPASTPDSDQADYASSSSHAPTRPPSSSEGGYDDDIDEVDFDEIMRAGMRESGSRQAEADGAGPQPIQVSRRSAPIRVVDTAEDDEEALWAQMHGADADAPASSRPAPAPAPSRPAPAPAQEDDEEMWNLVNEMNGEPVPSARPTAVPVPQNDDDMGWDMWDEMDAVQTKSTAPAPQARVISTVEEDYEDMYIDGS
ncbi:replication fork protection component Swi3-domain-containing protein, partial [Mycena sp. CBHHK59/15]